MSWSVNKMGMKEAVREACALEFDKCAKNYVGQEEEKDVLMAKERCLSSLDELKMDAGYNAVSVRCNGSRGAHSLTINVSVERITLLV